MTDKNSSTSMDDSLVASARLLYSEGRSWICVKKRQPRFDKGVARPQARDKEIASASSALDGCTSEATWHRKRKEDLMRAVATPCRKRNLGQDDVDEVPSMTQASKRLKKVEEKKQVEAQCQGHLLPHEKLSERKIAERKNAMAKDDRERMAREAEADASWFATRQQRPRGFFRDQVQGQDVWLENPTPDHVQRLVAWGGNSVSSDLGKAAIFLVNDSKPQPSALWHAVFKEAVVMNQGLLDEDDRAVFSIGFISCLQKPLKLFFSSGFEKKRHVHQFLLRQCDLHGSAWAVSPLASCQVVLCLESEKTQFRKPGRRVSTDKEFLNMLLNKF